MLSLAVAVATLLVGLAGARSVSGTLDPRAADPSGSRALAALLGDRGVDVRRVTTVDEATAGAGSRQVVVIAFPDLLPVGALRTVGDLRDSQVLLVAPAAEALRAVTEDVRPSGDAPVVSRSPRCGVEAATAAGSAQLGGRTYAVSDAATGCYPAGSAVTLALARTRGGARLAVLGSGEPLTNDRLDEDGNAALALNLLGADGTADEVRWLVPSPGSAVSGDAEPSDILPSWAVPAALQLLLAGLLTALWRARRLGPPVTEPLPVVVRAAETVEGRSRLYRRAEARDRASDALRAGARARLVPRLGLGRQAGGEPEAAAVVEAVASRAGRAEGDVYATLYGGPPGDDPELVRLADALDALVRDTLAPEVRHP